MASKSTPAQQVGATPGKLALIGALGVVLIVVLYLQFGWSEEELPEVSGTPPRLERRQETKTASSREAAETVAAKSAGGAIANVPSNWNVPEIAAVIQYDPFALPASFPQPPPTDGEEALEQAGGQALAGGESLEERLLQTRAKLEELRHLGVQVVLAQRDQYVALIGDRTIHVGDEINGFTVVAIDSDGVRVVRELKP